MRNVIVYVPRGDQIAASHIVRGSGIVGEPHANSGWIVVYFEGAIYRPENMITYADRVLHAFYRMDERAPTVAKAAVPKDSLIPIGTYEPALRRVFLTGPESEHELAWWLGVEHVDPAELLATHR